MGTFVAQHPPTYLGPEADDGAGPLLGAHADLTARDHALHAHSVDHAVDHYRSPLHQIAQLGHLRGFLRW